MKTLKCIKKFIRFFLIIIIFAALGCGGGGGGGGGGSSIASVSAGSVSDSITLAWDPPTENSDGSQLNDLAGYIIYYGPSSNNYTVSIDVGNVTIATINDLPSGLWCFTATAYDSGGNESNYSAEICENI